MDEEQLHRLRSLVALAGSDGLFLDQLPQLDDGVHHRFRPRWASGDVHVNLDQVADRQVCLVCRLVLLAHAV
jgi:hypothetical protein